ncbi:MAG: MBL fold metallo-hydrolase [Lachnospiraceae bacterium]|nr:MBL fold metallo-hydrolase [Candidatus Equihabitans merdae]
MAVQATLKSMQVGPFGTNCYFLENDETGEIILVDPGDEGSRIVKACQSEGKPAGILLTHGHLDHICGVHELTDAYPDLKVYAPEAERMLEDERYNSGMGPRGYTVKTDVPLKHGDHIHLAGFDIEVMATPGHTEGSVCYYLKEQYILFSGDTLFYGSYGRTDLPTGSEETLMKSLRYLADTIPEDVTILPGHGSATNLTFEKRYNPGL